MGYPAVPSPSTWSSGPILAAQLRSDVSNGVAWLSKPPMFIGAQTNAGNGNQATLTSGSDVTVWLDTELYDNYGGHRLNANGGRYYAMKPGWYLCEGFAPLNYTGTAGAWTAGIAGQSNGTVFTTHMGERVPSNGVLNSCSSAHFVEMVNTGTYAGASNDYIELKVNQNSGATQTLFNGSSYPVRTPYLSVRWVCSSTGTNGFTAPPSNETWPSPPSYITSSFLNTNIRDALQLLTYTPVTYIYYNGSGSLSSQSTVPTIGTTITLGSVSLDNYHAYSGSTWTAPMSGVYYAYGQVGATTAATALGLAAGLTVNSANYGGAKLTQWGGVVEAVAGFNTGAIVRRRLRLNRGDTVELAGFYADSSTGTAAINNRGSEWATRLLMIWRSA